MQLTASMLRTGQVDTLKKSKSLSQNKILSHISNKKLRLKNKMKLNTSIQVKDCMIKV